VPAWVGPPAAALRVICDGNWLLTTIVMMLRELMVD
jgi:hypothetical protein